MKKKERKKKKAFSQFDEYCKTIIWEKYDLTIFWHRVVENRINSDRILQSEEMCWFWCWANESVYLQRDRNMNEDTLSKIKTNSQFSKEVIFTIVRWMMLKNKAKFWVKLYIMMYCSSKIVRHLWKNWKIRWKKNRGLMKPKYTNYSKV